MIRRTDKSVAASPSNGGVQTKDEAPGFLPRVQTFAGPLDLLLYLIHKDEIDIFDIPIAEILDQYLVHIELLQRNGLLDLLDAGAFLVMASRLMEIKSRMLLPDFSEIDDEGALEEELEDPRFSLVEQLLEYRNIKERAVLLEEQHHSWSLRYDRVLTDLPPPPRDSLDLSKTTSWDLCAAFDRIMEEVREDDVQIVELDDTPLEVVVQQITALLEEASSGSISFNDIFRPHMGRAALVTHFLALLEMCRVHLVRLDQTTDFGDIQITRRVTP